MLHCKYNLKFEFFFQRETKKCCPRWGDICEYSGGLFEDGGCYIDVKHEVLVFQVEDKVVCKQLEDMRSKSVTPLWPKTIVHLHVE
jgi:hypothetical protein